MHTFSLSIRLNVTPDLAGQVIDDLAPHVKEAGLSFRSGVPGLVEGRGLTSDRLALLLDRLASLSLASDDTARAVGAGLIDDLWVHVSRER